MPNMEATEQTFTFYNANPIKVIKYEGIYFITISSLADALGVSNSHLYSGFKVHAGNMHSAKLRVRNQTLSRSNTCISLGSAIVLLHLMGETRPMNGDVEMQKMLAWCESVGFNESDMGWFKRELLAYGPGQVPPPPPIAELPVFSVYLYGATRFFGDFSINLYRTSDGRFALQLERLAQLFHKTNDEVLRVLIEKWDVMKQFTFGIIPPGNAADQKIQEPWLLEGGVLTMTYFLGQEELGHNFRSWLVDTLHEMQHGARQERLKQLMADLHEGNVKLEAERKAIEEATAKLLKEKTEKVNPVPPLPGYGSSAIHHPVHDLTKAITDLRASITIPDVQTVAEKVADILQARDIERNTTMNDVQDIKSRIRSVALNLPDNHTARRYTDHGHIWREIHTMVGGVKATGDYVTVEQARKARRSAEFILTEVETAARTPVTDLHLVSAVA